MRFEEIFKISTTAMRINRCHPGITRNKFWIFQFTSISIFTVSCFLLLLHSILLHDIRDRKYAEASKNCIMAIVALTISFKYIILIHHQKSIIGLIKRIDDDYELAGTFSKEEKDIIDTYVQKGVQVCKMWLLMTTISSIIFPMKAFLLMIYFYKVDKFRLVPMFEITFPYFIEIYKDVLFVYITFFTICTVFACYASSMYLGFDPLVPIFMLHCCGQLEVVSQRINKLLSASADEHQIYENLKKTIRQLQNIYEFVECVKGNFTVLYEFVMKTTTFLLPLSAFNIVECLRNKDTNLEFIPFFLATIVHFYYPCYYSNLLMEKSEDLRQTIYMCGWEEHRCDMRTRKALLFMLTRAHRPLVIRTVFYSICLDTFAEMCRTAYALFNIMNAAFS